ncbi:MAG TPA: RNA 2',3'-cyclic phosphodiesterase [Edaphobacter sp.]|nr:RNA 2',3'-cyclic phosphodiesterase [Edaphobacter sp.]
MKMRLFVGIALDPAVTDAIKRLTISLRRAEDGLRWSNPEGWHITLQFLGSTEQPAYECLLARLREIYRPPFAIHLGVPDVFERAGVFHIGVLPSQDLTALERHVVASTALCGFRLEDHPYHPHITLARGKGHEGRRGLHALTQRLHSVRVLPSFSANEFLLYQSFPTRDGSRYEIRERFPLQQLR